jgi:hypothetical protein
MLGFSSYTHILQMLTQEGTGHVFANHTYFISSAITYVGKPYTALLISSSNPELVWLHSASVAAIIELLAVTGFGNITQSQTDFSTPKDPTKITSDEIGKVVLVVMKRSYEMCFMTGMFFTIIVRCIIDNIYSCTLQSYSVGGNRMVG